MRTAVREKRNELKRKLCEIFDEKPDMNDVDIMNEIEKSILDSCEYFSVEEKMVLKQELFNSFKRLDILSGFLEEENISEIMINNSSKIFVEEKGKMKKAEETFESEERLRNVIQQIVSSCNRIVNETSPIVDARLSDGSRVNVVLPPVSLDGAVMTIRRFPKKNFSMEDLVEKESITKEAADFLKELVIARYNIFISGGTGSGKTTFLNALSDFIPGSERIITIEDAAELKINNIDNLIRLETRNANVEGENAITMSDLIKTALRMRPDRIIVGEVRDAAAMDMANSMLTGHDGSISTGHGNSAKEMMLRLETMILMGYDMPILAIRQHLAAAIDIVVHLSRLSDGSRKVVEISEVAGVENGEIVMNKLYELKRTENSYTLQKVGELKNTEKIKVTGKAQF